MAKSRRAEDLVRDWGDHYGEKLTGIELSREIAAWRERIMACSNSGISVRAWCKGNGISTASNYKWQKKRFCLASKSTPQFAAVCVVICATVY